jgi:hypothetical protein
MKDASVAQIRRLKDPDDRPILDPMRCPQMFPATSMHGPGD